MRQQGEADVSQVRGGEFGGRDVGKEGGCLASWPASPSGGGAR